MHDWLRWQTGRATLPTVLTAGVLVGLCTVPCSGAIYLGVLGLLAARTIYAEGLAYLVLYNAILVLPLVAMMALASSGKVLNTLGRRLNTLGRRQLHHGGA